MDVRVAKEVWMACEAVLDAPPFAKEVERDSFRWHTYIKLDLADYKAPDLVRLRDEVAKFLDTRGAKTLHRDVSSWLTANETPGGLAVVKARTCNQAYKLVTEYIRRTARKHVYEREQEGIEGVMLCYWVERIEYHSGEKREGRRVPSCFRLKLYYEEFGTINSTGVTIQEYECLGLTAHQILVRAGLLPETPTLRADYEANIAKYGDYYDKVGTQCHAIGVADDRGIDGNDDDDDRWWRNSRRTQLRLDKDGEPARVVIDIFHENPKTKDERDDTYSTYFWGSQKNITFDEDGESEWVGDDDEVPESTDEEKAKTEIPIHPYIAVFDLKRHKRLRIHVGNLELYKYDTTIRDKLILPKLNSMLIDNLLANKESTFRDVLRGKSGGTIILCQGPPGTGKTLTAEIYSEALGRPLYNVQCAQLGTDADALEDELLKCMARARRWAAVMLLDESDVYVHTRGNDLQQNAIVGVFLRTLEYHAGVLFMTTNRGDLVDDAILSRCTARIPYGMPAKADQLQIWRVLADANSIDLSNKTIAGIVDLHPHLSGRDIKNLLKLANYVALQRKCHITPALIDEVKIFKPTTDFGVVKQDA